MTDAQFKKFLQELYRHVNGQAKAIKELIAILETEPQKMVYNNSLDGDGVVTTPAPEFED